MKPEHYNILLEKFGKEQADKIRDKIDDNILMHKAEKEKEMIAEHERLERMVEKMIPKNELKDCAYYTGYRWRGAHVATWDQKIGKFKCINWKMGDYFVETLNHFEDVRETTFDGFIPFEEILPIEIK